MTADRPYRPKGPLILLRASQMMSRSREQWPVLDDSRTVSDGEPACETLGCASRGCDHPDLARNRHVKTTSPGPPISRRPEPVPDRPIRVVIAEDHAIVLSGLASLLALE